MERMIPPPTISEILQEEFLEPMGISAYRLAQEIHVPTSRIQDILHGRRALFYPDVSFSLNILPQRLVFTGVFLCQIEIKEQGANSFGLYNCLKVYKSI